MDFQDKVVVVPGGGSGIGQASCREFAAGHAAVAIVDRDEKGGRQTPEELHTNGGKAGLVLADISVRTQVESLIRDIVGKLGGINILVNNTGIRRYGSVLATSEELWDEVMEVNLKSAFLVSKHAIPEMRERGGGSIVITGSVQSFGAIVNSVAYVVSKLGLLGLARSMALDQAKRNI